MKPTTNKVIKEREQIYEVRVRAFDPNAQYSPNFTDQEHYREFEGKFKLPKAVRAEMRSIIQALRNRVYHGCKEFNHSGLCNVFESHFGKQSQLAYIIADCDRTQEKLRELILAARNEYGIDLIPISTRSIYVIPIIQAIPMPNGKDERYESVVMSIQREIWGRILDSKSFQKLCEALEKGKAIPQRSVTAILRHVKDLKELNILEDPAVETALDRVIAQLEEKKVSEVKDFLTEEITRWDMGGRAMYLRRYAGHQDVELPNLPPIQTRREIKEAKAEAVTAETPLSEPPTRKIKRSKGL